MVWTAIPSRVLNTVDNRRHGKEIPYHGLPCYLGRNAFFRLNACNYCMDVFAETADACFMDAWLPAYREEPKGTSLVVVRNAKLSELLEQGQVEGEICLERIGPEEIVASQRGHVRRKRELIYIRRRMRLPEDARRVKATAAEEVDWLFQRYAQTRSRKAWVNYGRKYGRWAFWLAMTDVVLMQGVAIWLVRMSRLPNRFTVKCRRLLRQST